MQTPTFLFYKNSELIQYFKILTKKSEKQVEIFAIYVFCFFLNFILFIRSLYCTSSILTSKLYQCKSLVDDGNSSLGTCTNIQIKNYILQCLMSLMVELESHANS